MDVNDCEQEVSHNNENSGHFDCIPFILYSGEECFAVRIHVLRLYKLNITDKCQCSQVFRLKNRQFFLLYVFFGLL